MTEEFLQYIWKYRLLSHRLQTTEGEELIILHPGEQNFDSGPDFFNAKIRIGSTVWAGNVEIHLLTSDWLKHGHQHDKAYETIILHVVFREDIPIQRHHTDRIPTLVIDQYISRELSGKYQRLLASSQWIPCQNLFHTTDQEHLRLWAPSLAMDRLKKKSHQCKELWKAGMNDWENLFYLLLARSFGFHTNAVPFELLARATPLKVLLTYERQRMVVEAILYGQANLLNTNLSETYPKWLLKEYAFFRHKYQLTPLQEGIWKFLRMRPSNFPTIRISQFASAIGWFKTMFSAIRERVSLEEWLHLLACQASDYWTTHYTFHHLSPARQKIMGRSSADLILINAVIPFVFFYGSEKNEPFFGEWALEILEQLPAESNSEITQWERLGIHVSNALQAQALLQLKGDYCDAKKCLHCRIGNQLLNISGSCQFSKKR